MKILNYKTPRISCCIYEPYMMVTKKKNLEKQHFSNASHPQLHATDKSKSFVSGPHICINLYVCYMITTSNFTLL